MKHVWSYLLDCAIPAAINCRMPNKTISCYRINRILAKYCRLKFIALENICDNARKCDWKIFCENLQSYKH